MSKPSIAVRILVGMMSVGELSAQPSEVRLVFMPQGQACRLVLSPKWLQVDLEEQQAGVFYWEVENHCSAQKSLHIDQDPTASSPCSFCQLDTPVLGTSGRQPNLIPSWADGAFGYRVRLCDPNTTNNCVEHDPEVEVRRPRPFDDTVRVVLRGHDGACSPEARDGLRLTSAYAAVTWLVLNGCRVPVKAQARRAAGVPAAGEVGECSRGIEVPAGKAGRLACLLPPGVGTRANTGKDFTIAFELVLDKPVQATRLPLRVGVSTEP